MPNICEFNMKVIGKDKNVSEFLEMLTDYDLPKHFWRVFDDTLTVTKHPDDSKDETTAYISGDCAWSIYACMTDEEHSYAADHPEEGTSLQKESERLSLSIEVFSWAPEMGFSEHFAYQNGETLAEETCDYGELYVDDLIVEYGSLSEAVANCDYLPETLTEADVDENGEVRVGGFKVEWSI